MICSVFVTPHVLPGAMNRLDISFKCDVGKINIFIPHQLVLHFSLTY